MKKRSIRSVLIIALLAPGAWFAQSRVNGGAGHFKMGYANYSMSAMNDWLPARYPQLRSGFTGAGGGGYGLINNLVIGGEGMGFQGTSVSKDTLSVVPSLGMGMFNLGYVVYQRNRTLFFPVAGIGGGNFVYKFKEVTAPGLTNRVSDEDYEMSSGFAVLSLALAADKFFMFGGDGGVSVSLRLGVTYTMQRDNWKRGKLEVSGPVNNTTGFFVTLGVGGGGWSID